MGLYPSGTTGRLENSEGCELGIILFIGMMKFTGGLGERTDLHRHRRHFKDADIYQLAASRIPEWQLLVAVVVIVHHNGVHIMDLNKIPETDRGVLLLMLFKMLEQHGYLHQVMYLGKREEVDSEEEYAGDTLHRAKILFGSLWFMVFCFGMA